MTTFTKTLKNYVKQVIDCEFQNRYNNEIDLSFTKKTAQKSCGDMYFQVTFNYVYVIRQCSRLEEDYRVIIDKRPCDMTKDDWKLFYRKANEMKRKSERKNILQRLWITDFILINNEQYYI